MADTIFTKIIRGETPCHKIYEDDKTFAFLDIHPVQPGHVLIIPKNPIEFVWDLPDDDYHALMDTTKKVAQQLRHITNCPYVHERIVGTDVPHAHVHLIPFSDSQELRNQPDPDAEPDHPALAHMAEKLKFLE